MPSPPGIVVILGTGGTIAGTAGSRNQNVGYKAAQLGVAELVAAVPPLAGIALETEQLAQLNSKDMDHATWQRLAQRAATLLARADVSGVVVTHGTDTLEESAWLLQRVLAPAKPLVLTGAMRPATSMQPDGPQNLLDAVTVAREAGVRGVLVVLDGTVHGAADVRKSHPYRLDAFDSGDAGPLARIEEGRLRRLREWPTGVALGLARVAKPIPQWPWVEIVGSHAGARGAGVAALLAAGVEGLVVAGTGNGEIHAALEAALDKAAHGGVAIRLASRCAAGALVGPIGWPTYGALGPFKSRVELLLELLDGR